MTARLGELLLAAAPDAPPAPDRLTAVAARVRRQRIVTSALAATAAAVAVVTLAGVAGAVLAEPRPARRDTPVAEQVPAPLVVVSSAPAAAGPRFEATTEVVDAADGSDRPTEVTVAGTAAGTKVWVTDMQFLAPQGDTAELVILVNGRRALFVLNLENFREYDTHFLRPIVAEGPIVFRMTCRAPGRPATACRATVRTTGTTT